MRHVDLAGNQTTVTNTFTVDTVSPNVSITAPPLLTNSAASINVAFTFSDNVGVSTVECRTNSGSYAPCTSPYATGALQEGNNNVYVRVTDTAGNMTIQSVSFTVDTTAPGAPTITSGPTGTVSNANATFNYTTAEPGGIVECQIDGGTWQVCTGGGPVIYLGLS